MSESSMPANVGSMEGLGLAAEASKPRAWAIFVDSGNARMWGTLQPHVQKLADAEGLEVTPLYDQAALDAAVAAERERCVKTCTEIMDAYGGDPAGRLLSSERVRMQHQLQAAGAAQCITAIEA